MVNETDSNYLERFSLKEKKIFSLSPSIFLTLNSSLKNTHLKIKTSLNLTKYCLHAFNTSNILLFKLNDREPYSEATKRVSSEGTPVRERDQNYHVMLNKHSSMKCHAVTNETRRRPQSCGRPEGTVAKKASRSWPQIGDTTQDSGPNLLRLSRGVRHAQQRTKCHARRIQQDSADQILQVLLLLYHIDIVARTTHQS